MRSFQFLGIPPKGERDIPEDAVITWGRFPISRDPPEGGTGWLPILRTAPIRTMFPISRDPPEGGTRRLAGSQRLVVDSFQFLGIPPKGELFFRDPFQPDYQARFQFLGIPPKGEHERRAISTRCLCCFQFLGIPPKGELDGWVGSWSDEVLFPISRDPPEGGTRTSLDSSR